MPTSSAAWLRLQPGAAWACAAALVLVPLPVAGRGLFAGRDGSIVSYLAILLAILALGAVAWFLWVRAEIRSLQAPAFLVLRRDRADRLAIAGAEREAEIAAATAVPLPYLAVRNGSDSALSGRMPGLPAVAPRAAAADVVAFSAVALTGQAFAPPDATLQFLPGRLEFVGEPRRPDIHFVRQPGAATLITMGRANGAPDRHIRVSGPTVSRVHARLRFAAGRWTISNLSATNPLRVNGRALAVAVETCVLAHGDRLELGEVAFVFREK